MRALTRHGQPGEYPPLDGSFQRSHRVTPVPHGGSRPAATNAAWDTRKAATREASAPEKRNRAEQNQTIDEEGQEERRVFPVSKHTEYEGVDRASNSGKRRQPSEQFMECEAGRVTPVASPRRIEGMSGYVREWPGGHAPSRSEHHRQISGTVIEQPHPER